METGRRRSLLEHDAKIGKPRCKAVCLLALMVVSCTPVPVSITNTPLAIADQDNSAKQPFHGTATIATAANGNISIGVFTHPTQIVVIQFVSGTCQTNSATTIIQLGIETIVGGVAVTHTFIDQNGTRRKLSRAYGDRLEAPPNLLQS